MRSTVNKWVSLSVKVSEPLMRKTIFREKMFVLSPDEFVEALFWILSESQKGKRVFMDLIDSVHGVIGEEKAKNGDFFSKALEYAESESLFEVVRYLSSPPCKKGIKKEFHPDLNQLVDEYTLGERRFLAKSSNMATIERLLFDTEPQVTRALLLNPRLTSAQVIRIAAKRPVKSACLEEIYKCSRWISNHDVKVALVRNPHAPPEIALKLLPSLHIQELRDIRDDSTLIEPIRESAADIINKRKMLGSE